jgi:hypothetical protein
LQVQQALEVARLVVVKMARLLLVTAGSVFVRHYVLAPQAALLQASRSVHRLCWLQP